MTINPEMLKHAEKVLGPQEYLSIQTNDANVSKVAYAIILRNASMELQATKFTSKQEHDEVVRSLQKLGFHQSA